MRYDLSVFMYDPALQPIVLAKLAKWDRLTESDLNTMLRPEDRLRLRLDMLADMAHHGLITMRTVGDEPVLTITEKGREWLMRHGEQP
jgi:hypothetical protein